MVGRLIFLQLHFWLTVDGDGFLDVVGGITPDAFGGISHSEDHAGRNFNDDSFLIHEGDGHQAVFDEVILGVADEFRGECDGFVILRVGENVVGSVLVTELHLLGHHRHGLDFFRGAEADVGGFAGADAAKRRLHKRAEVAGGAMLHVEDDTDVAVVIDRLAAAEVVCVDCHKSFFFSVVLPRMGSIQIR